MEKTLSLYTYIDGINDMPFPNADEHIIVSTFTYDAKRMGDAPSINFTIKHTACLDSVWTDNVYASFKGEKYFLKQTPTSAYDNSDSRYKHDVVMVSERIALNEAYFFDVVSSNSSDDRPVSNSSEVVFFGDVHEFALRLNASLLHSRLDYKVIVDDGVTSEAKLMSFKNQFFSNVLQEFYNTYNMPYYFVGKEIHVGQEATIIDEVFEYGVDNSLLSIEKSNANYKVVTRCTGTGGKDNIPYYYPNPTPYGDMVCLLNGKESSNVRVIDWARFARCGVDGVLSYNEKTAASGDAETPQKVYVGSSIYFNTVAIAYGNEWEAQSEPFELEYAHNYLFINGSPNSQVIASWEWFVIDENDVVRENGSWSTGDTGIYLDKGIYTIKIKVRLKDTYGDNNEAEEVARNYSYIDIYKQKQQVQYTEATYTWQLNDGSYVTLNSVGVNYDGTPQVGYTISFKTKTARIPVSTSLMPPIYRESLGKDRFYVAKNNTYKKANSDEYYSFNNIFVDGRPKDHIIEVDDIKPTIANVVNANNERIDSFIEFAYDLNDNDELDAENRYEHSFFYAKLRKMDGDFGFNLFDHASESGNMTVSMTSGVCGACNWEICVDENTGQNAVRVDENGNLLRDADGNVLYKGSAGRTQNDTTTEEVWVQLRKEDNTYGILMPNKAANHRPSVGDTFVLTNISLPQAYILAAEERLKHAIIEYMAQNNDEKFNFSIKFSRIYLAQHEAIMAQLSENATLKIKYNGVIYTLHVSSYSYKMSENAALPEIVVQLSDTLTVQKNALQNAVSEIRYEVDTVVKSIDVGAMAAGQFVSKVNEDVISGTKTFLARSVFGDTVASKDFTRGSVTGVGWALYTEDVFNKVQDVVAKTTRATTTPQTVAKKQSVLELDKLIVRGKLEVNELTVNQAQFQKGTTILSGGACEIESIEVLTDSKGNSFYRCYYNNEQGTKNSGFFTGDFAKCLRFDMSSTNVVKEYWREVVGVGTAYVDLAFNGSSDDDGIPAIGDNIIQMGNKDNPDRQSFIVIDPLHKGSIQIYSGVNSFSLEDRNYVGMGVNPTTNEAYLYGYGDIYIGDRDIDAEGANFITYQKRVGDNKRKLFIAADIMLGAESTGLSNMSEFLDLKDAVDKAIDTTKDIEYLKNTFESGNILEVNGAILSSLIGVTNNEGILKAGLYGGGSYTLNDKGYFDEEHGAMLLFGGIDGADKPTTYKTAIFEDGYIESEYFATAREGARVEMFDNQVKIFGSDGSTHILMGWSAETGNPELQYVDANGARPWLITSQGISNAVTLNTEQKILAVKDFDKGLKIGGISVSKLEGKDIIYLDGNLVVRGGITMYGSNGQTTPSIWDDFPYDNVTIKRNAAGKFYAVGGGGSGTGGLDYEMLDDYLTTNGYITSSGSITGNADSATTLKTSTGHLYARAFNVDKIVDIGADATFQGYSTYIDGMYIRFRYGSANVTAMQIGTDGNVAIGGTTADELLHVYGVAKATLLKSAQGYTLTSSAATYCGLIPNNIITGSGNATDFWLYNTTDIKYQAANHYFVGGNVAIGGSTATEKLHLYGNMLFEGEAALKSSLIGEVLYMSGSYLVIGGGSLAKGIPTYIDGQTVYVRAGNYVATFSDAGGLTWNGNLLATGGITCRDNFRTNDNYYGFSVKSQGGEDNWYGVKTYMQFDEGSTMGVCRIGTAYRHQGLAISFSTGNAYNYNIPSDYAYTDAMLLDKNGNLEIAGALRLGQNNRTRIIENPFAAYGMTLADSNNNPLIMVSYYNDHAYVFNYKNSNENSGIVFYDDGRVAVEVAENFRIKSKGVALSGIDIGASDTDIWQISHRGSFANSELHFYHNANGTWSNSVLSLAVNGDVATGGNLLAKGAVTMFYSSDRRLKRNIRTFNAAQTLLSLGGVYEYEYSDAEVAKNPTYAGTHYGLIYQNVKGTALGSMCYEREDGMGQLNYLSTKFLSLIAGATMENTTEIERLKERIRQLEERLA